MQTAPEIDTVKPFLRWAGGKRWLVHRMPEILGSTQYNNYYEPFLGGGSIFFGLHPLKNSYLSDVNTELINAYIQVRKSPRAVSHELDRHQNSSAYYYEIREKVYSDATKRAAQFIFLNHTSFNGLHRVNLSGKYNVPYGNRKSTRIPSLEQLIQISTRLKLAKLSSADFEKTLGSAKKGDLVFLDPPYTVAHSNNGFIEYNRRLFAFEDQGRLAVAIDRLRTKGAFFIMTNAFHDSIAELFERGDRRLIMTRANAIGGKSAQRGSASEYLFTNLPAND